MKKNADEVERKKIDPFITWAPDYCKNCFTCINICPVDNLKFEGDQMVSLNKCIQCQLCMKYCPDFSIEVSPKKKARGKSKASKVELREKERPSRKGIEGSRGELS